jgi:ABC-type glucose/galactose transport system permease subunit
VVRVALSWVVAQGPVRVAVALGVAFVVVLVVTVLALGAGVAGALVALTGADAAPVVDEGFGLNRLHPARDTDITAVASSDGSKARLVPDPVGMPGRYSR